MVFGGIFPSDSNDYQFLKDSIENFNSMMLVLPLRLKAQML